MKHYLKDRNENEIEIEELGWENGKIYLSIFDGWNYRTVNLKMYYRPERTWDDHLGNTPCGYYANVPITRKQKKRVYLYLHR